MEVVISFRSTTLRYCFLVNESAGWWAFEPLDMYPCHYHASNLNNVLHKRVDQNARVTRLLSSSSYYTTKSAYNAL
jgi:hypothetical protein